MIRLISGPYRTIDLVESRSFTPRAHSESIAETYQVAIVPSRLTESEVVARITIGQDFKRFVATVNEDYLMN